MEKSIEKLAEELHINVYDAYQFYDKGWHDGNLVGQVTQHQKDVEWLEGQLPDIRWHVGTLRWQNFKEMKLE